VDELDTLSNEQLAWLAEDLAIDVPGSAGRDELLDALAVGVATLVRRRGNSLFGHRRNDL
jgi:hypothetical protein